jgi:DivIVA domain-containing protein
LPIDRQDIERRDFPIGRRGYEPEAVDAHLRRIADEVEDLGQGERPSPASLATAASEQVRSIVEAAETTAGDIERTAEDDAARTRQRAQAEADQTRADASEQARGYVMRVQEATQVMLQRVDAMESELVALVESLRTGANRLSADLTLLQGNMGELRAAPTGGAPEPATFAEEAPRADEVETEPERAPEPEPEREPEPDAEPIAGGDDSEGARLIALNMALNGTPRDETDRYLADNFSLADREQLLDEVYARVG